MQFRFHLPLMAPLSIASALVLSGCSSAPQYATSRPVAPVTQAEPARSASSSGKSVPVLPKAGSGRGAYYQDDGPGDDAPDGLHDIPDAQPMLEAYSRRGNRPYVVFGKSYTPFTDGRPYKERGRGSWYGKKFHGQKTSSGERYDMYKMTAAHPTLPIPSYARVTHLKSGTQVIVRVNDRGPFHSSRIIDLSYTAALKLGYISQGSAELEVERLLPDEIARMTGNRWAPQAVQAPAPVPVAAVTASVPMIEIDARSTAMQGDAGLQTNNGAVLMPVAASSEAPPAAIKPTSVLVAASGFYIQLGAYMQAANAEAARVRLAQDWAADLPPLEVVQHEAFYRVHSGPFASRAAADSVAERVKVAGAFRPVIVRR